MNESFISSYSKTLGYLVYTAGCDVLRALHSELATMLDARIVAVNMYQRNALTLKELQSIRSLKDRPVEAAETLLNIIMEQADAVYVCFVDVLKHTEQLHIYHRLVEDGYKGKALLVYTSLYKILQLLMVAFIYRSSHVFD